MKQLLACMPVDRSKLPRVPGLDAIVITDLYSLKSCVIDGCGDVWIGPRQLATYNADPDGYEIACYMHAISIVQYDLGGFDPDKDVAQLGGGYPVEGRARIA